MTADPTTPSPADRLEAVRAWLTANGINPSLVPRDADITTGTNPAGRYLDCEIFDCGPNGHLQADETGKSPARLVVRVPLKVEPPAWWEPHVKPTRDQLLAVVEELRKVAYREPPRTPGPPGEDLPGGYDFGWDAAMTAVRAVLEG